MDHEQIVLRLIGLFEANEVEAFRANTDEPAMQVYPDALGEQGDKSAVMTIAPVYSNEEYINFELSTEVATVAGSELKTDIYSLLNGINIKTSCGAYLLLPEENVIIHRHMLCAPINDYENMVALAVNNVLTAIDSDISMLSDL